jgi:hypothetical protein
MKMSAIASYLLPLGQKTAIALRRVHLVLEVNTIDSRKVKGEMMSGPFFDLELYGIHPCGPRKSESAMLWLGVFHRYEAVVAG